MTKERKLELIERVYASRTPKELSAEALKDIEEEHIPNCLQCLRAKQYPEKFKPCDGVRIYSSVGHEYAYDKTCPPRQPSLHCRLWDGVEWYFPAGDKQWHTNDHYIRVQWCCSTFQVVVGHHLEGLFRRGRVDDIVEELIYHEYAQCE